MINNITKIIPNSKTNVCKYLKINLPSKYIFSKILKNKFQKYKFYNKIFFSTLNKILRFSKKKYYIPKQWTYKI